MDTVSGECELSSEGWTKLGPQNYRYSGCMYRRNVGHQPLSWPHEQRTVFHFVSRLLPCNGINLRSIIAKGKQFFYIRDANMNQLELRRYVFGHGFTEKNCYQNYSSRGLDNNFFLTQGGFPLPCHFYVLRHKFYMCK